MALTKVTGGVVSSTTNLTVGVITATKFVGPLGVGVTGDGANFSGIVTASSFVGNITGDITGNADTATALETARTIGGVSFDGTAAINLPGVNKELIFITG